MRRSVERDVEGWVGWPTLMRVITAPRRLRDRGFLACLFLTGGRVREVLSLRRESFDVRPLEGVIVVRGMRLLKRYRKVGEAPGGGRRIITEPLEAYRRPFPILLAEPPASILLEWLRSSAIGLLWPSPFRAGRPLTRWWAWKLLRRVEGETGIPCWPHWFRAQRASQLVEDYGFEVLDLVHYFGWRKGEMALHYASKGWRGLASKMRPLPQYAPQRGGEP